MLLSECVYRRESRWGACASSFVLPAGAAGGSARESREAYWNGTKDVVAKPWKYTDGVQGPYIPRRMLGDVIKLTRAEWPSRRARVPSRIFFMLVDAGRVFLGDNTRCHRKRNPAVRLRSVKLSEPHNCQPGLVESLLIPGRLSDSLRKLLPPTLSLERLKKNESFQESSPQKFSEFSKNRMWYNII